jgi:hypothetical protein
MLCWYLEPKGIELLKNKPGTSNLITLLVARLCKEEMQYLPGFSFPPFRLLYYFKEPLSPKANASQTQKRQADTTELNILKADPCGFLSLQTQMRK